MQKYTKQHVKYLSNNYDMITIDLAGHGNSASLEVTGYVDQIEEILIAEGVKYAT